LLSVFGDVVQNPTQKMPKDTTRTPSDSSSTADEELNSTDQSALQLHPIACTHCRRLHKRCDKMLPKCKNCIERGTLCIYKTPNRKGRKIAKEFLAATEEQDTDSTRTMQQNEQSSSDGESVKHLQQSQTLEMYYYVLCTFPAVKAVEREEFEIHLNEYMAAGRRASKKSQDMYLMFLAIRALGEQRCSMTEAAEDSMLMCRRELGRVFFEHSNFYVACTYAYLIMYEAGCGRLETAQYYMESVYFYIRNIREEQPRIREKEFNFMKFLLALLDTGCTNDFNLLTIVKQWPDFFSEYLEITLPAEWKVILSQKLDQYNFRAYIKIIDFMDTLASSMRDLPKCDNTIEDIFSSITTDGMRILVLEAVNEDPALLEQYALKITQTTQHELFTLAPSFIIPYVAAAARSHLNIVKMIEKGLRANPSSCPVMSSTGEIATVIVDYYSVLRHDLHALEVLSKKYQRVKIFHGTYMEEMEQILRTRNVTPPIENNFQQINPLYLAYSNHYPSFDLTEGMRDLFSLF